MKKYSIIIADPPWSYNRNWGGNPANGGITYPTMTISDIYKLPIKQIADKNCALFLWIPHPKLMHASDVMFHWGFDWKTTAFDWTKISKNGKPRMGLGHYTRSSSELCLLGIKGSMKRHDATVMQSQSFPIDKHSAKPLQIRDEIFRLFGNQPTLELFARDRDPRIDTIGNAISGLDIKDELQMIIDGTWVQS